MRTSRVLVGVLIAALIGFGAGRGVAWRQRATVEAPSCSEGACCGSSCGASCSAGGGACCTMPEPQHTGPAPAIPTASGRPCLAVFTLANAQDTPGTLAAVAAVEKQLSGKADIVRVDPGKFIGEAQRWRLRRAPTLLVVSAAGKEEWRHEGPLTAAQLRTGLQRLWPSLSPSAAPSP
jgi:hypothetical protein